MGSPGVSDPAFWDDYAKRQPQDDRTFGAEPVQRVRSEVMARRVGGTVLDVGGGDGYQARLMREAGATVTVLDVSPLRCERARALGFDAVVGDAVGLPYPADSFDTVVLGEVLEHLADPGEALAEAFRVSRGRVVVSLPLKGWCDPTHQWRIRLDHVVDPEQDGRDATRGQQIVLTFDQGPCWPIGYEATDPTWAALFEGE